MESLPRAPGRPSADDLLLLREVATHGTFLHVADALGVAHSTVARRVRSLEKALGYRVLARTPDGWAVAPQAEAALRAAERIHAALTEFEGAGATERVLGVVRLSATEGFTTHVVIPAVTALREPHPGLSVEMITTTRQAAEYRPGIDFEVMVGKPTVRRADIEKLGDYRLGLYASRDYLAEHGTPGRPADLDGLPLIYFVESVLQVDALGAPSKALGRMHSALSSTSVYMHIAATAAGGGFGYLPCFMAAQHPSLVRVLPETVTDVLPYWLVARSESLRRPAVALVVAALRERTRTLRGLLLDQPSG
ncbi:LysR family transcriptional regulator [Micrococcales bacterium 31B]|nr:LysR family transcriptional regulator [Micrococcales bacterium 31B]